MAEVRQRKKEKDSSSKDPAASHADAKARIDAEDNFNLPLDIARFIVFVVVAFCGLSYVATGGESWVWQAKTLARYTNPQWWKGLFKGDEFLTLAELSQFDGSDPEKPIYLSINGTIYDVSANPATYGPGGSYHWFAGVDASRGFVTGCFSMHRTRNLKGAEVMFLPLDDPKTDAQFEPEELAQMKDVELDEAKKRVHDTIKHWVNFFAKSDRYMRVGKLVMPEGWEDEEPPEWCDVALKGRSKRKVPKNDG